MNKSGKIGKKNNKIPQEELDNAVSCIVINWRHFNYWVMDTTLEDLSKTKLTTENSCFNTEYLPYASIFYFIT